MKKFTLSLLIAAFACISCFAQISIKRCGGWLETAYVEWELYSGADMYNVYYKQASSTNWTKIDDQLVRNYGYYGRADVMGISAGTYDIKVVATANGTEIDGSAKSISNIAVESHDRAGFAFMNGVVPGAYKADGTLKENAKVIYVDNTTFDTVEWEINKDSKGTKQTCKGVQEILSESVLKLMQYNNNAPICIRIIGEINTTGFPTTSWGSSAEGLQVKASAKTPMNVTIEGVGEDACINGFGILCRNTNSIELRNFGVLNAKDDDISLDTDNLYSWVHNLDLYYGKAGGDSDQAKGDGTVDVKGDSKYQTYSYNHFWDSGKCSLCGMKSESGPNYITYHHNWFDHSDSRHPRVRTMTVHVYNNYYDGVAKYGVGATTGSNVFVEANYFRNTNRPMMSSKQGTDATGDGTFSGETGGMIKSYGNQYVECGKNFSYITANDASESAATAVSATSFDAYEASTRNEQVPSTYKTLSGGTAYSNFDTDASLMPSYTADKAVAVPAKVKRYAGRLNGGDIVFVFNNTVDDASYAVNSALKSMITNYTTSLVSIASFTKTTSKPKTYTATFLNEDGSVFETITGLTKVEYPSTTPDGETGYTFTGWSVARGTELTADIEVYPSFSDGSNTEGEGVGGLEVINNWVFTSWSSATQTEVKTWVDKGDNSDRYQNASALNKSSLGIAEADGLLWTAGSKQVTISIGSKGKYIQTSALIYIPAKAGETLTIAFSNTGSKNGTRYLLLNGTTSVGQSGSSTQETATINVTESMLTDGYLTIQCSSQSSSLSASSFNYYYIKRTFDVSALTKPVFKFSEGYCEVDLADSKTQVYPTLTNTSTNTDVTYTSSDESVATVNAQGNVTALKMGTVTITAKIESNSEYRGATAKYTIKVKDSSIPTYTVTYMADGKVYATMEEQYTVVYPEDTPEKEGYTFTGWDVAEGTVLSKNVTVTAKFMATQTYTVKFLNSDGSVFEEMENQTKVVYPSGKPTKSGYTFKGWNVSEGTVLTEDIDIEPVFEENTADVKPEDKYEIVLYTSNTDKSFYTSDGFFNMNSTSVKNSSSFGPFTYEGIKYQYGVKFNKGAQINFTLTKAMKLVIIFNASKPISVDGNATSAPAAIEEYPGLYKLEVDLEKGDHVLNYYNSETQFFLLYLETIQVSTTADDLNAWKEVAKIEYYRLNGERIQEACKGVNIVKTYYNDGTSEVKKMLKR